MREVDLMNKDAIWKWKSQCHEIMKIDKWFKCNKQNTNAVWLKCGELNDFRTTMFVQSWHCTCKQILGRTPGEQYLFTDWKWFVT